jgi:hypothetical protein
MSTLPAYAPYTIRATWHYGNDYRVTEHSGPFIIDALIAAAPDMPDWAIEECLIALRNREPYRGWSWLTLERVDNN